ncbi:MAG: phytoene desaturase family protein [Planctomycetota bacterium]|jgi:phytoene dehydrogenase-like protein
MTRHRCDVLVVGAGHNGLVAAIMFAQRGLRTLVVEACDVVGGAVRTERPFAKAPGLATSTGAYLLGVMPPELMEAVGVEIPLRRRDPHYFLPTTDGRSLLLGSDREATRAQLRRFFSEADLRANDAMLAEIEAMRDDIAPTWLEEPLSIEETAERFVRPALRDAFVALCRGSVGEHLDRFGFESDLLKAMYAVTDGFSGLYGTWDTPGTGMNFLVHNMCRLPGSDGTWMIVEGGMGTVTRLLAERARELGVEIRTSCPVERVLVESGTATGVLLAGDEEIRAAAVVVNADPFRMRELVGAEAFPDAYNRRLDSMRRPGSTFKVNLALSGLPKFTCLPEALDRQGVAFGPTIHLLPDESEVMASLRRGFEEVAAGRLPEFPTIEWYIHTTVDPSMRDAEGRHNSALFVQWVPHTLAEGSWDDHRDDYARHLLSICDRFAPGTSDLVVDMFALDPGGIERHFGITGGHIHHIDNAYGFSDRVPYRQPVEGLYSCSAGTHPAGSVIGAAGHNAAMRTMADLGV